MGRRFQQSDSESDGETKVDLSPLIDCVFILLIFFIVTTTFVDEKGKEMPTPDNAAPPPPSDEEPSNVLISVMPSGDVMSGGRAVGLSGVSTLIQNSRDGKQSPVLIQAIGDAQVGVLMRVKEEAERAGSETISVTHRHGG